MSAIEKFIILPLLLAIMFLVLLVGSIWGGYAIFQLLRTLKDWGLLP